MTVHHHRKMKANTEMAADSMALIITQLDSAGQSVQQWHFASTDSIVVGRGQTCDVALDDHRVSRRHAVLSYRDGQWVCKNVSRNGMYAEDVPVESTTLSNGSNLRCSRNGPVLSFQWDPEALPVHDSSPGSVSVCLGQLPDGDDAAQQLLWDRYFHRVAASIWPRYP